MYYLIFLRASKPLAFEAISNIEGSVKKINTKGSFSDKRCK